MLQATILFTKKDYALLGKLLFQKKPEIAQELLAFLPTQAPAETDLSKIPEYFRRFCEVKDIDPKDYTGSLYKSKKVYERRIFVAAMVHLYNPEAYLRPIDFIRQHRGLTRALCEAFCIKAGSWSTSGNVSNMIREVIIWEKNYDDFAEAVSNIITQITTIGCTEE
jgi:hypothetical protein